MMLTDPQTKGRTNQDASLLKMYFLSGCFINAKRQEALAS